MMAETSKLKKENIVYKCWKISGNFNHAMESCAKLNLDLCLDLPLYKKCPMGHKVLF